MAGGGPPEPTTAGAVGADSLPGERTGTGRWEEPRPLPGVRVIRTTLRTAHLIAFGILYGGHVYGLPAQSLLPALVGTVVSGAVFMGLEIYRTPLWLVQIRGLATVAKIALVVAVGVLWSARVWLLTLAVVIGSVASHMPGRYRYYSVLHGRAIGEQESG